MAGGNIDPADSGLAFCAKADGAEEIVLFGVEQDIIGESARGDNSHDVALDNALCSFGVFDLLADCDLIAGL